MARHLISSANDDDAYEQMTYMVWGYRISQMLRAMVDMSIADHLAERPMTAHEIATRENTVVDNTFRLMRAGVAVGLLSADPSGRFHSTALLDTLRRDAPRSLRGWVMSSTGAPHWLSWNRFTEANRTGSEPTLAALGTDLFTYFERNPGRDENFRKA